MIPLTMNPLTVLFLNLYTFYSEVVACLALLGGFTETLKPGSEVQQVGKEDDEEDPPSPSAAVIVSGNEESSIVSIDFHGNQLPVQVPKCRLAIVDQLNVESRNLFLSSMSFEIIDSMLQVLTTDELDPLSQPLPVQGPSIVLETARLVAEIRTRTCQMVIR